MSRIAHITVRYNAVVAQVGVDATGSFFVPQQGADEVCSCGAKVATHFDWRPDFLAVECTGCEVLYPARMEDWGTAPVQAVA